MANILQGSSSVPHFTHQGPVNPNSSSPQDIENTTDPQEDSPRQPTKKKTCGQARPYIDWGTGRKLEVQLNTHNQPIGKNAPKLTSQLGVIARSGYFCPIIYNDWRCKELGTYKERIWKEVKDNCNVSSSYKETCLRSIGNKWRNWKDLIRKTHYYIYDNDEERLANVPDGVDPDQWKVFVPYQSTAIAKQRSITNRENQKRKVMAHTSGRKSHAVVRDEMTLDGEEPECLDVYTKTHTNSDGSPVDQAAAEVLAAIKEKLLGIPKAEQTRELRDKVFTDVLGCDTRGRVRTFEFGPCPTQVFGNKNKQTHEQPVSDVNKVREVVSEEMREEVREEVHELVKEEIREVLLKELREEFTGKFEQLERHYAGLHDKGKVLKSHQTKSSAPVQQVSDARISQHHTKNIKCSPIKRLNVDRPKMNLAKGNDLKKLERQRTGLQNNDKVLMKSQARPSVLLQRTSEVQSSHHESRPSKDGMSVKLHKVDQPKNLVVDGMMSKDSKKIVHRKLDFSHERRNTVLKYQDKSSIPVQQVSDAESSHHQSDGLNHRPFKVGSIVNLLNIANPRKIVAEGTIISKDPKKELDGVRLGDGFWIVRIDKVLMANENLLISRGDIRKLGQAINKNLFWRVPDIMVKKK